MFYVFEPFPPSETVTSYPKQDHAAIAEKLYHWLRRAFPCGVMMELEKLMLARNERRSAFVKGYRQAVVERRGEKWLKEHDVEVF